MMLYVQDRTDQTLEVIENYYNDEHNMLLEQGVSNFKFTTSKDEAGSEFLIRGNHIVFADDNGESWMFTIMSTEETHGEINVECEDLGLELLNKIRNSWASPGSAKPFKYYFDKAVAKTGWEIGINEISNLSRTLEWEGRDTALKRLLSIATQFDNAEIEFKVELKNTVVTKKIVNVYKKRGADRSDVQLIYGDTVNEIRKTTDIKDLATALEGIGSTIEGTKEGEPEKHYDFANEVYDNGDFYSPKGDPMLYARTANQQFNISNTYLEDYYEYDTKSSTELLNRTITQLTERSQPKVNYEVDLVKVDSTLNLGDTVVIIDHDYKPELLLSGRVLELDKCYSDPSKNKAIFGNFLILHSNIRDELRQIQDDMKKYKPNYNFTWIRYAENDQGLNMSSTPNAGTKYIAVIPNQKTGVPSDNPSDYTGHWQLMKGSDGTPGKDGSDGKTTYTHYAWADDTNGSGFTRDDGLGKGYFGIYSDFNEIGSDNYKDYAWTELAGAFDDQLRDIQNDIASVVKIYTQASQPENAKKGDQWWQTDDNGSVIGYLVYDGTTWQPQTIQQSMLNIVELNAVSVNGANINGSKFTNNFDYTVDELNQHYMGVTNLEKGIIRSDYSMYDTTGNNGPVVGQTQFSPEGFYQSFTNKDTSYRGTVQIGTGLISVGATLSDGKYIVGIMDIQDVYHDEGEPKYLNGWGVWNSIFAVRIIRNGRQVTISGYIKHNNSATYTPILDLPTWAYPKNTREIVNGVSFNSSVGNSQACNLAISNKGKLENNAGVQKGGYLSFSASYVGADIT